MRCHRLTPAILLALTLPSAAMAQRTVALTEPAPTTGDADTDAARTLEAVRLNGTGITIDGVLDEAAWQGAPVAGEFVQLRPDPGAAASQRTEARVVYDADAIYVALRLYDSHPDSIVGQLARRDEYTYSDWAYVGIDSYNDRRTAFFFSVNPAGVKGDSYRFDDTNRDDSWDAVWNVATSRDAEGWIAEFRIPFSQLRYSLNDGRNESGMSWGINFGREIARRSEESFWAPISPDEPGFVSQFGSLSGLRDLARPRRLEVVPYAVSSLTREPGQGGDPYWSANALFGNIGGDIKYGVTSDLTLTATINPDFGQVEADPSQVNLSPGELFFSEKRPFFIEGADIFRFGIGLGDGAMGSETMFYTRRIGRPPQAGLPDDLGGDSYNDVPGQATILGAAKLSGKTANGWSIGVLEAVTAEESAPYVDTLGAERHAVVEPLTHYAVVRAVRDFRQGKSAIGGIFTATNRRLDGDPRLDFLRSGAYGFGVNGRHRFGPGDNYEISTTLGGSYIHGSTEAIDVVQRSPVHRFQRPDADHLDYDPTRTSLAGAAGKIEFSKIGTSVKDPAYTVRWTVFNVFATPGYEVNDLGFQRNSDYVTNGFWVGISRNKPWGPFRRANVNINEWQGWTTGGERTSLGGNVNGGFQLHNFWGLNGGIGTNLRSISTGALRGGPSIIADGGTNAWFYAYTDQRKAVWFDLNGWGWMENVTTGDDWGVYTSANIRPSKRMELSIGPQYGRYNDVWSYVGTPGDAAGNPRYVFAEIDQRTFSMTARLSYTFTPNLSLQLYAQPYISGAAYGNYIEVADPMADTYEDRYAELDGRLTYDADDNVYTVADAEPYSFGAPDFNFKSFNSNVVLRWEYRPGSTLFLVWGQGRNNFVRDGSFSMGRDFRTLFGADDSVYRSNVFLVKLSYWFGM